MVSEWFKRRGRNPQTVVAWGGYSITLDGEPTSYTDEGIAQLGYAQSWYAAVMAVVPIINLPKRRSRRPS